MDTKQFINDINLYKDKQIDMETLFSNYTFLNYDMLQFFKENPNRILNITNDIEQMKNKTYLEHIIYFKEKYSHKNVHNICIAILDNYYPNIKDFEQVPIHLLDQPFQEEIKIEQLLDQQVQQDRKSVV